MESSTFVSGFFRVVEYFFRVIVRGSSFLSVVYDVPWCGQTALGLPLPGGWVWGLFPPLAIMNTLL